MNLDVRSGSRHSERSTNRFEKDTPRMTSTKERSRGRKSRERSQVYSRERKEVREDSRKLCNPDDRDQRLKSDRRRTSGYHSMNASSVEASRGSSRGKQSREVIISSESEDEPCRRKSVVKPKYKSRDEDRQNERRIPQHNRKK